MLTNQLYYKAKSRKSNAISKRTHERIIDDIYREHRDEETRKDKSSVKLLKLELSNFDRNKL